MTVKILLNTDTMEEKKKKTNVLHHNGDVGEFLDGQIMRSKEREEILQAFLAKYGCGPDEIAQVEQKCHGGITMWFVSMKKDIEEMMK